MCNSYSERIGRYIKNPAAGGRQLPGFKVQDLPSPVRIIKTIILEIVKYSC